MAPASLPISRLIQVGLTLTPQAAQQQNLSQLLILGDSTVIDVVSRMRLYSTLTAVATDFGTSAPEYLAASLWFAQNPQPTGLLIGRWAQAASKGQLFGATLSTTNSLMSTWTAIANGGFKITVDGGGLTNVTGLNFTGAANLNAVAAIISAGLTGATCVYNAVFNRFEITSNSTGATSVISFLVAPTAGTNISALMGCVAGGGGYQANGIAAETAVQAATIFDQTFGQQWYALTVVSANVVDADHTAIAAFIEGTSTYHFYGVSTQAAGVLSAASTTDIAFVLAALKYNRTAVQYSASTPYSVCSLLARILTTNYQANNTVITLMYKQEPGITAENLNTTQITALEAKNCNVFVAYNNNTAIIEPGVCCSGLFIDVEIGSAALVIGMQTALYNALYTSPTKIPQTNQGMHILATAIEQQCSQFVVNGLLAPGQWNSAGFGTLNLGDNLSKGYYVFTPPIEQQSQSARAARLSVSFQVAAKLAGAVHDVVVNVTVNS